MTGNIIRLEGDRHREIKILLPWYVTGQLDPAEQDRVTAHVRGCRECQEEVRLERRLEREVASASLDVEHGWRRMRSRLEGRASRENRLAGHAWLAGALAAQAALLILAGVWLAPHLAPAPAYHALASAPVAPSGNVLVMFRPDVIERALRADLTAAKARVTDGPTTAGAWVIQVPAGERARALAGLRSRRDVALAEPLDSGAAP
ncbi:MAG TPA: zf-HC2 domain-containing protein [Caulobacteraceae bacterium]